MLSARASKLLLIENKEVLGLLHFLTATFGAMLPPSTPQGTGGFDVP